jgi:hypothetical protein
MTQERNQPDPQACHEFQEQLPELIGSGQPLESHPHVKICENCRALIRDLETIAEAARQLLPVQQPEDDLWDRIESAIKADEGSAGESARKG